MLVIVVVPQSHTGDREWSVEIYNSTAHDVTYWLFYVDHPFQKQWPRPMNIAGGALNRERRGSGNRNGEQEGISFYCDLVNAKDLCLLLSMRTFYQ